MHPTSSRSDPTVANLTDCGVNWLLCQQTERLTRKREYPSVLEDRPPVVRRTEKETVVAKYTSHLLCGVKARNLFCRPPHESLLFGVDIAE